MNSLKRFFTLVLATLFLSSQALANSETLVHRMKQDGNPTGQIAVTVIPEEEQREFLSQVQSELEKNPLSAALIATTGGADPIRQTKEYQDISQSPQVVLAEASSLDHLPAPSEQSKNHKSRLKTLLTKHPTLLSPEKKAAVAVSVIPAGNYGALVYFMSADYILATASFGTVLAVNAFQAIFTKQWLQFASLGDKGALKVLQELAKLSGKNPSNSSRRLAGSFGRIGLTVGMNIALASITMTLSGTLDSIWALLYFGYSSSYDLWDQILEKKINNSTFFKKHFINSRLAIGSLVECFALAGNGIAEMILLSASAASTVGILFKSVKETDTPRPTLREKIKVRWQKFKSYFDKNSTDSAEKPCFLHLSPLSFL